MRLIDGNKLYNDIINNPSRLQDKGVFYSAGSVDRRDEILDMIKDAPTIDAEPVVHAHYYRNSAISMFPICSRCHMINAAQHSYCESCGAKMDEVQK